MKTKISLIVDRGFSLAVSIAVLFLVGCGGGTSGTGDREFTGKLFSGPAGVALLGKTGELPLPGIEVTIAQTGDSSITDAQGNYSIVAETDAATIDFLFAGPNLNTSYTLSDIPADATKVTVDFKVSTAANKVEPDRVDITRREPENNGGNGGDDSQDPVEDDSDDDGDGDGNSGGDDDGSDDSADDGGDDSVSDDGDDVDSGDDGDSQDDDGSDDGDDSDVEDPEDPEDSADSEDPEDPEDQEDPEDSEDPDSDDETEDNSDSG